jgi:hypothetical protein
LLGSAIDPAATRPALPGDVGQPALAVEVWILLLAEVCEARDCHEIKGFAVVSQIIRKADEVFFAHLCVSLCVFVCVCVLQRQQQEADSEDEKDGEDLADGFEVVHVRQLSR